MIVLRAHRQPAELEQSWDEIISENGTVRWFDWVSICLLRNAAALNNVADPHSKSSTLVHIHPKQPIFLLIWSHIPTEQPYQTLH